MNCKMCKNCEPKIQKPPFDGVKTDELEVGMVLKGYHQGQPLSSGFIITAEKPDLEKVKIISILKGSKPHGKEIFLADYGCQPYENGSWNLSNCIREVT